jgi:hypothetical protein
LSVARHAPLLPRATLLSPCAPDRGQRIGFVFLLDFAWIRPKSQYANG